MAILNVSYLSMALYRTVSVDVILPADKVDTQTRVYAPAGGYKTLYLLHGLLGSEHDWVQGTRIRRWAEEKNLAVVMPAGENAFYIDHKQDFRKYGTFIGQELPMMMRRMFPLSDRREDTFIAGLSMGGFGALRNGIVYGDTFSRAIGLSSAVHVFEEDLHQLPQDDSLFGDPNTALTTDINPKVAWLERAARAKEDPSIRMPEFYMACGTEDFLLEANRRFRDFLLANGASVHYEEEPGGHEWDFWDRQIKKVVDWLPLDESSQGLSSGNVK